MTKDKPEKTDKSTAASHIINVYNSVANLRHWYALYLGQSIYARSIGFDSKKDGEKSEMPQAEIDKIRSIVGELRYHCIVTYKLYKSLAKKLDKKLEFRAGDTYDINALYESIAGEKASFVMDLKSADDYLSFFEDLLVNEVLKNLLETSQDILESIYNEEQPKRVTPQG